MDIPVIDGAALQRLLPVEAPHIVADLAELMRGAPVRARPEDVTLFKSVGMAFEDLVVARSVIDRAGT